MNFLLIALSITGCLIGLSNGESEAILEGPNVCKRLEE